MKNTVLSILLRFVNSQYKKDINYDIALVMLKNYNDIPHMTINDIADLCFASPSSISRFVKMIGFDSFLEFKKECEHTLKIENTDYSVEVSKAKKEDIQPIFERFTHNVEHSLEYCLKHLDYEQLDRICQKVYESQKVLFLGLEYSTLLGQHFQNRMALMNKYISIGLSYEEQLECVKEMEEGSVVFIASIEGGYLYRSDEVMRLLKEKNAYVIVLTMNQNSKLMKVAQEIVLCGDENSNTEGRISLLYIIEMIIMYYCINFIHLS